MAERPNAKLLKSFGVQAPAGSNPAPSAYVFFPMCAAVRPAHTRPMICEAKNLDNPDEKRSFDHGDIHAVNLSGVTIGRAVFRPGWRWTSDVKPVVGTDSCQGHHMAYVVSGRLHVRMDDGGEIELGPGDAHVVGPGHDAWVVGDEPCVTIDFIPAG